jgi:hypothetical protein
MALTRIKTNQITDLAVTGAKIANNAITAGKLANNLTYGSDFTVSGNLTVSGTTTSVSTTNTRVEDAIIALSAEATGSASVDSGLLINRGADDNQAFLWDETADEFVVANVGAEDGDTAGNVTISSYAGLHAGAVVYGSLNDGTTTLTTTVAELNIVDGDTSATATTVASGDRVVLNDAGTMVQVDVDDIDTYFISTTQTLSNKTLTAPKIADAGFIADANGNELVIFTTTASAVNEITLANAATSGHPTITTTGGDTNINLVLSPKGSGTIDVDTSKIVNVTDPTSNQDAATKAYVDGEVSSASVLAIAGDSGTDNVTVGSDTFTFSGTANEIVTAVTDNTVTVSLPDDITVGGALTVTGNLTVNGTTTTISTTNSVVSDNLIELNNGAGSNANDSGIVIERGSTGDNAIFVWDESADAFIVGTTTATGDSTGDLTITAADFSAANITATGSFIIGSADMNETDLEKLDGITNGTAAANKALVVDANLDIGTLRNITGNGNIDISSGSGTITTNVADTQILFSSSGVISGDAAMVFDGTDVTFTGASNANSLDINSSNASISSAGIINTVEDIRIAADNKQLEIGANSGGDFTIGHDGTDTTITNVTGILAIDGAASSSIRINEAGANVDVVIEGDTNTALVTVDASGDNVGIGGAPNANAVFHVNDTGAMILPVGTTAQRPGTGVSGMFRYNTTSNSIEYYDNDSWESVSSSFTLATSQTFNGDDSTTAFTLSSLTGSDSYTVAGVLVMLNGVVQEPTTVYGISGTTLTFTTAPASGDLIEVRKFTTTTTVTALSDLDGDTLIQVEEGSDDDTIRFDVAGTETAVLAAGALTLNGQADLRFADADSSNWVAFQAPATVSSNVTWTLPSADAGTSGFALVSDGAGTLSFAAAGATTTSDTTTNAEEQIYFGDITSGAVTALHHDAGLTYNPSTGTLTSAAFAGDVTGDVTGTADVATTVTVADESSDTTCNVLFTTAATGNLAPKSGTNLTFNSSNGTLAAPTFSGEATSAQYADLAEMYAADEEIAPGTVVHFAGEGKLAECDIENCRAVAGIVSTDPAHLMNAGQEGVALALAGRVPCKVTGPVAAGDLMVSAGNGMAMANNEATLGTVIGKAIEANADGEGVIEVLALMM